MRRRLGAPAAAVAVALALAPASPGAGRALGAAPFPCRWSYTMFVGLRAGYVTGGENADCGGLRGTLTLSARLYRSGPAASSWRLDRSETRSFSSPRGNRFVEFDERCSPGRVRATFSWVFRDGAGRAVARTSVRSAAVADPGPHCAYTLR